MLAVYSIYKIHQHLLPDATELIQTYIADENDQSAKRNALLMLMNCSLPLAVSYYHKVINQISNMDEGLQLIFIELIRKNCQSPSADKVQTYNTSIDSFIGKIYPNSNFSFISQYSISTLRSCQYSCISLQPLFST